MQNKITLVVMVAMTAPSLATADDSRARALIDAAANIEIVPKHEKGHPRAGMTLPVTFDWDSAKGSDRKAEDWARACRNVPSALHDLARTRGSAKRYPAYVVDPIAKRVKRLRCVAAPKKSGTDAIRFRLKVGTLTYFIPRDVSGCRGCQSKIAALIPELKVARFRASREAWFAKFRRDVSYDISLDYDSFADVIDVGPKRGMRNNLGTQCQRVDRFIGHLNLSRCYFKMCDDDQKKIQKHIGKVTKIQCSWSDKPKTPAVEGDTLRFYLGDWTDDGNFFGRGAFMMLRKKIGFRSCGHNGLQRSDYESDEQWQKCCPKDRRGRCMKKQKLRKTVKRCSWGKDMQCFQNARDAKAIAACPMVKKCYSDEGRGWSKKQIRTAR